jgi:diguanylate cyclase (GGDEF)-like protein
MNELAKVISQAGLEVLLEHIHAVVILVESDGRIISWNSAFNGIRQVAPQADTLQEFLPGEEREDLTHRLDAATQTSQANRWHFNFLKDLDGSQLCCDCLLLPVSEHQVLIIGEPVVTDPAISQVIEKLNRQVKLFRIESEIAKKLAINKHTEMEAVMVQMQEVSNIDSLTFLPNRREIIRQLQYEVLRTQRYNGLLSVSILDLDHFKFVNDTYGHVTGDRVLREVALLLRDGIRQPDVVGRYGGEEFLILLPNTDLKSASRQAAPLCKTARELSIQVDNRSIHVTLSIGVVQFQSGVDTWQTVLTRADTAMYEAKRRGRDQWVASGGK